MNFEEAMVTYTNLDEASFVQVNKRLKRHIEDAQDTPSRMASAIKADSSLIGSLSKVTSGSNIDKNEFITLMKNPLLVNAFKSIPDEVKTKFNALNKIASGESAAPEDQEEVAKKSREAAQPRDNIANLPKERRIKLNAMQKEWLAIPVQQRRALGNTWLKSPETAWLYRFGIKEGIFKLS